VPQLRSGTVSLLTLQFADVSTVRADRPLQLLPEAHAMTHKSWCAARSVQPNLCNCGASGSFGPVGMTGTAVGATGPIGATGPTGPTGMPVTPRETWMPNRDPTTEAGHGWASFIRRLDLNYWPETERTMLRGQDGWAFAAAVRFQTAAYELADADEAYYWSSYHLLALIIERARNDLTFLEAIEALAVAHLYGGLSKAAVAQQLQQMEIWP
jgi:hypothetical protein